MFDEQYVTIRNEKLQKKGKDEEVFLLKEIISRSKYISLFIFFLVIFIPY